MSSEVEVSVQISSEKCELVVAIKKALEPDNIKVPPGMRLEDAVEKALAGECVYKIKIKVKGCMDMYLKRARSTVDEILAIVKALGKSFELAVNERHDDKNA